jgi:hypothetical protein
MARIGFLTTKSLVVYTLLRADRLGSMSIDEFDLLNFFATPPEQLDPDVPWPHNDSLYEAVDGHVQISFAIAPSVKDVRIILKSDGVTLYELNAMGIEDVNYHHDKGRESLEIILSERNSVWLRIKPQISITQTVDRVA